MATRRRIRSDTAGYGDRMSRTDTVYCGLFGFEPEIAVRLLRYLRFVTDQVGVSLSVRLLSFPAPSVP
ncbi:hypothetical protein C4D60_Mb04t33910 [Musa balbisiana]|uniref:Uncharacterized protein n=1 Tax=Musa balbisiana TaxID=52838 RepID=A0A4S8KH66_MUSBA|nr:hypothetical protein C4D60_Mb04t33910 [Musa balbisiana]